MKVTALLIVIVALALALGSAIPARYVEEHETITQLLWNQQEALIFAGVRRDGWAGSYTQFALQLFRGMFGDVPEYESKRTWVRIARIKAGAVTQEADDPSPFFHPQPAAGMLFRGDLLKWTGNSFTPASAEERTKFTGRVVSSEPDYSNVEGWSSRMNLFNRPELRVEVPIVLEGATVLIVAERNEDRTRKSVVVQFQGREPINVMSIQERMRLVGHDDYTALVGPR